MRWLSTPPDEGEIKIKAKFLFLPRCETRKLDGKYEWRWFEYSYIKYQYQRDGEGIGHWVPVGWASDDQPWMIEEGV